MVEGVDFGFLSVLGRLVVVEGAFRTESAYAHAKSLVAKGTELSSLGGFRHAFEALSSENGRVLGATSRW